MQDVAHWPLDFKAVFEAVPGLYLILHPDFTIAAASRAFLVSTMKDASIVGQPLFHVFPDNPSDTHANGVHRVRTSLLRVLRDHSTETMPVQRYDIQRPDGSFEERYWSPINAPVLDAHGNLTHLIHRVEDVTETIRTTAQLQTDATRAQLEVVARAREVQTANAQLQVLNDELQSFSYTVSHDLRAPLRAMIGFSRALMEDCAAKLTGEERQYLQHVNEGADHMQTMLEALLALSKVSRQPLHREPLNLSALAQPIAQRLQADAPTRRGSFVLAADMLTHADPSMMAVLLENLLTNAWKFTGKKSRARIEMGQLRQRGETVFYIRDNGSGFDMAHRHKLFGAFQRLHGSDVEGTGIGLASVYRIVRRHEGRIWAEAEVGCGATFYFTLAASTAPAERP